MEIGDWLLATFIVVIMTGIDQYTKLIIKKNYRVGQTRVIINKFLAFTSIRNRGAVLGKLPGKMRLFYLVTIIAIAVFCYLLYDEGNFNTNLVYTLGLLLLLSGTMGNFVDRIRDKEVVDFIHFFFTNNSLPIFNIADLMLILGTIMFGIAEFQ